MLERFGGIVVYEVADPRAPRFVHDINTRNFSLTPGASTVEDPDSPYERTPGDLGPELNFRPGSASKQSVGKVTASTEAPPK